jgi:CDP-glycerol glycerophosphotransferase (TagB/SpsB family)
MIKSDILSSNSNVHVVGAMNFTRQHVTKVNMDRSKDLHIMYAATRDDLRVVDQLIRAAKKFGGIYITIKSHPNTDGSIYNKYSSLDFVTVIKKKIPIQEMMSKVDLFVTTYSSSHIYAAICGIPIMLLAFDPVVENNLKNIFGLSRYKEKDIVITDKRKLYQVVREFQKNKRDNRENIMTKQDEYISNLIYLRDREEDVINDILNVLNSKKIA